MTPEKITSPTKLCPTCGSRVKEDATRCLVCGADLTIAENEVQAGKVVQGSRMPAITLSLPGAIGLLALFLVIGAVIVFFALRQTPEAIAPPTATVTITATATNTQTPTNTPLPTLTFTPEPSPTPITYSIKENDTCIDIAAFFQVSVQSIVTLNNLPAACNTLYVGQSLLIPQPTPTATALPSATYSVAEQTEAACQKVEIIVQSTDTLGSISANYNVPMEAIKEENGLPGDTVYLGQPLVIPLCRQFATPGPSPTATPPPPYAAPNLLLPANGAPFTIADDLITLQWASVGSLLENESYRVTIEDLTAGQGPTLIDQVTDTKYIVPSTIRPADRSAHIFSWYIEAVRISGSDENGNPVWSTAGLASTPRYFSWTGAPPVTTPTP
ncbi:MAG TPA: LysM peptidoglycan-binding domain-containing protein [Anaerolineales bacterium]|nr:LysM peptidoglycan-binding domain-containing protein [Anaerolineales bacterium]